MALTVTVDTHHPQQLSRDLWAAVGTLTPDSSYPTGGWDAGDISDEFGTIKSVVVDQAGGYLWRYDDGNDTVKVFHYGQSVSAATLQVTDDDSAASNGTDVYVVTRDGVFGWLESVCANNADTYVELSDGEKLPIRDDDDAASRGVALYLDEDASTADRRFFAVLTGAQGPLYIPCSNGQYLVVSYDADPGTNLGAVACHVDDNGATATDRLLAVTDGDANVTTNALDDSYLALQTEGAMEEVANGTNLSSLGAIQWQAIGFAR